jgi:hypothetical protein
VIGGYTLQTANMLNCCLKLGYTDWLANTKLKNTLCTLELCAQYQQLSKWTTLKRPWHGKGILIIIKINTFIYPQIGMCNTEWRIWIGGSIGLEGWEGWNLQLFLYPCRGHHFKCPMNQSNVTALLVLVSFLDFWSRKFGYTLKGSWSYFKVINIE